MCGIIVFLEKQQREEISRPKQGIAETCGSLIEETYVNRINRLYGEGVLVYATEESENTFTRGPKINVKLFLSIEM